MKGIQPFSLSFLVLLFLMGTVVPVYANIIANETSSSLNLIDSERAWLRKHKKIRLAFDGHWPPYSFKNKSGQYEGLAVDYVRLLADRLGVVLELYPDGQWDNLFEAAKQRKVDVVATMVKRPEREQWFIFSEPYITLSNMIISKEKDNRINSRSDIAGHRVALVKGYFYINQIIKEFPSVIPHYVDNVHDALMAVSTGAADVAIASPGIADYIARQYGITNLKYPAIYAKDIAKERFGVRNDWPELVSILNKALNSVTEQERHTLFNKWISPIRLPADMKDGDSALNLTDEEQLWIEQHPVVRVAPDPHFHPVEFVDENGIYRGITADYLHLIGRRSGLNFKAVVTKDFSDSVTRVQNGEAEMLSRHIRNEKSAEEYLFSKMILGYPTVLLVRRSEPSSTTIKTMAGRKTAVPESFPEAYFLNKNYPDIIQVTVPDIATGMRMVSSGELTGVTAYLPVASSVMEREGIYNLRIAGDIGLDTRDGFAVRRDLPLLQSILDKGLRSITPQERMMIHRRWISLSNNGQEDNAVVNFTRQERDWLNAHPTIRIGIMNAWPPMDYVDSSGTPQGIGVEFIKAFNKRLNNRLEIVPGIWDEIYRAAKEKRLDALMDITPLASRKQFFHFTEPYLEVPHLIFTRKDAPTINSLAELAGMTVGIEKGFFIVQVLHDKYPQVKVKEYTTTSDVLDALSKGEVDAYVGNRAGARFIIENELITNVKAQAKISETSSINAIGVRKDLPILHRILQKVLNDISPREHMQIINPFPRIEPSETKNIFTETLPLAERAWLSAQTEIHIGVMDAWPPMSYVNDQGVAQGIGLDYLEAINRRLGGMLVPKPAPFKQNYEQVKNRQLDGIMDITPKPDREPFFEFTKPYMAIPHVFVGRKDGPYYDSADDLNGRIVALEKGYYNVKIFRNEYPQVMVKEYGSTAEALDAVSRGEADAYAGNRVVAMYLIDKELLINLVIQGRMKKPTVKLNIGVRKDWPMLARIIDRAIADISPDEARQIHKRWVGELKKGAHDRVLKITKEERAWLDSHSALRLGIDHSWPPVEWIDENGRYQGITSEYIELITEMLGLSIVSADRLAWTDVLEKAKRGEIDLLPAPASTPERRKYLNFTKPYLSFPFVIFTPQNAPLVTRLMDLYGKTVAVEDGYVSFEYLQRDHPMIKLIKYKTTQEILAALSMGKVDAYVGNLTVTSYLIKKSGYTNIKVAAPTPYNFDLSIGVRKDWPELIPILDKALSMIDEEQRNEIRQKWLTLHYEKGVDYKLVRKVIVSATVIIVLILLCLLFVYRKEQMLQAAKAETDNANKAYQIANAQLLQANSKLKEMDKMKSMFIASISHELRTPLNSIIGFSGMMMQGTFGELNEKYQDYIMRVNRSGQHLLGLITEIIDISKIEAGRVDVMQDHFALDEIFSEAVKGLRQQIEKKGLSLKVDVPQDVAMCTDKRRLYQCLLNLLSNAMKYSEEGGIVLTAEEQDDEVLLTVSDTGIGVSKTDQTRLFEAFERMESHLKVNAGGTGLGLYLTKKIATDLLQGDVGMESELGRGSTFWIRVPKKIKPQKITVSTEDV